MHCSVPFIPGVPQAYVTDSIQATPERLQALLDIIAAFPEPSSEETTDLEECSRFIAAAIKWAGKYVQLKVQSHYGPSMMHIDTLMSRASAAGPAVMQQLAPLQSALCTTSLGCTSSTPTAGSTWGVHQCTWHAAMTAKASQQVS